MSSNITFYAYDTKAHVATVAFWNNKFVHISLVKV